MEVVSLNADGEQQRRQILTIERRELTMETLGMNLTEGKALLSGVQDFVVAQQAGEELEQRCACPHCGRRYMSKDSGSTPVSTVFGRVEVPNPRNQLRSGITMELLTIACLVYLLFGEA